MSFLITVLSQSKTAYGCARRMGSVADAAPVDDALDLGGVVAVPIVGALELRAAPLGGGRRGRCPTTCGLAWLGMAVSRPATSVTATVVPPSSGGQE